MSIIKAQKKPNDFKCFICQSQNHFNYVNFVKTKTVRPAKFYFCEVCFANLIKNHGEPKDGLFLDDDILKEKELAKSFCPITKLHFDYLDEKIQKIIEGSDLIRKKLSIDLNLRNILYKPNIDSNPKDDLIELANNALLLASKINNQDFNFVKVGYQKNYFNIIKNQIADIDLNLAKLEIEKKWK